MKREDLCVGMEAERGLDSNFFAYAIALRLRIYERPFLPVG